MKPDVIHANDWMTGLIPAYARRLGIPSLFTVHNIHTHKVSLADIEDAGIDAAMFWNLLYFDRPPAHYEETRETNMVDLLCSGIFASHFINSVSPTFLEEVVEGRHDFVPGNIAHELWNKSSNGVGCGILNAPDEEHNPSTDDSLHTTYNTTTVVEGKRENKVALQRELKLTEDPERARFSSGHPAWTRSKKAASWSLTSCFTWSQNTRILACRLRSSQMARTKNTFTMSYTTMTSPHA